MEKCKKGTVHQQMKREKWLKKYLDHPGFKHGTTLAIAESSSNQANWDMLYLSAVVGDLCLGGASPGCRCKICALKFRV
jgi:hypothetical protein